MCQPGRPGPQRDGHCGSPGFACFQRTKSSGSRLLAVDRHALARPQIVERLSRELSVTRELAHRERHVALGFGLVREVFPFQQANQIQHLRDVLGRPRLQVRRQQTQRGEVLVHRPDVLFREFGGRHAALGGAPDDLVFHVGDVADVGHAQAARTHPAHGQIEGDERARMAEVAEVVHRHATHVHADMAGFERDQRFDATRQRVVDLDRHAGTPVMIRRAPDGNVVSDRPV